MAKTFSYLSSATRLNPNALGLALLAALLVGCDAPGTARLKELCETEGFPKVYQQVSAAGYYDDINECGYAVRFLVDWEYGYVECRQTREMSGGPNPLGLYRISKVRQVSGLCDQNLWKTMANQPVRYKEFMESGMCFSVQLIEAPGARYGLFNGESYVIDLGNLIGSTIAAHSMYILDRESGELVAKDKSFLLYPTPGFTISSFQRMLHCNTVVPENRDIPSLINVDTYIKPTMTNRESSHGNNRGDLPGSAVR